MTHEPEDKAPEQSDSDYLIDLANRLMNVPASYGVDGFDIDQLQAIAQSIKAGVSS